MHTLTHHFAITALIGGSLIFVPVAHAATGQGSVSLWSNSDCNQGDTPPFTSPVVIKLNYTLSADECGNLPRAAHSYEVDQRPTCDNGTVAAFAFYNGNSCQTKGFGPALNSVNPSDEDDGLCLALVEFNSVAFICDGLGGTEGPTQTAATTGQEPSMTSVTSLPTATPIAPGVTTALYTTSLLSAASAGSTGAYLSSGLASATTFSAVPSPSPFTGTATDCRVSYIGLLVACLLGSLLKVF